MVGMSGVELRSRALALSCGGVRRGNSALNRKRRVMPYLPQTFLASATTASAVMPRCL